MPVILRRLEAELRVAKGGAHVLHVSLIDGQHDGDGNAPHLGSDLDIAVAFEAVGSGGDRDGLAAPAPQLSRAGWSAASPPAFLAAPAGWIAASLPAACAAARTTATRTTAAFRGGLIFDERTQRL